MGAGQLCFSGASTFVSILCDIKVSFPVFNGQNFKLFQYDIYLGAIAHFRLSANGTNYNVSSHWLISLRLYPTRAMDTQLSVVIIPMR